MRPAIEEELHRIRAGKHGQPLDYCACQEMRLIRFQDDISASAHGLALGRDAGASKTAFPRWSVGTINPLPPPGEGPGMRVCAGSLILSLRVVAADASKMQMFLQDATGRSVRETIALFWVDGSWGVAPGWYGTGLWPSCLGRCHRLRLPDPAVSGSCTFWNSRSPSTLHPFWGSG